MPKLLPTTNTQQTWTMLFHLILKTPTQFTWLILLFIANSLTTLITPTIIGQLIDQAATQQLKEFPWQKLTIIATATLLGALLTRAWTFQGQTLGTRLNRDLSTNLINSSLKLDAQTTEDAGSGDLLARLTDDIDSIRQTLAQGLPEFTYITIYMLVIAGSIFTINPTIGLVTLPMFLGQLIILTHLMPRVGKLVTQRTQANSTFTVVATENIRGTTTIKELGIQNARTHHQTQKTQDIYKTMDHLVQTRATFWALDALNSYLPLALTIIWGAICVEHNWATWGHTATASLLLFSMRTNSDIFTYWLDRLRETTTTMGRVFGVINLANQQTQKRTTALAQQESLGGGVKSIDATTPALELKEVTYGYEASRPVISALSLRLEQGSSLALVGRSGSGKTTLARLIAGSLTADSGSVQVMGQGVGYGLYPTGPLADGRPALLICTQEAHQFVGTLGDNMTVASPNASEMEQLAALHAVGADWVDELPDGLATVLGIGGVELTRDQIQQLSLARIVAANPHVVILDESTTQLELADARESLAAVMKNRAVVIISHDARIASLADKAVLLEAGNLVAEGSPADIFARA